MARWLDTFKLRAFAFLKIPLIYFTRPTILEINEESSVVKIPLRYRTKNHVNSMYFGALSIGADLCIGLLAMHHIEKSGDKIVLVFKDFKADYKKLAKGDVEFICREGDKVAALVKKASATGERQNQAIHGFAVVPSVDPNDPVMEFTLTLSLKRKN